jgi:phospholipid transport system substrate-binding protein
MRAVAVAGLAFVLTVAPFALSPVRAESSPPTAAETQQAASMIGAFYATLLATMKEGAALGFEGRVARLTPSLTRTFDFPAMTRLAAGAVWPTLAADEQRRLIDAFSRFSIANYAANFDSYNGERFDISGEVPAPGTGGGVIVESQLTPSAGDPVQMNYLLRVGSDGLRVLDIFVNGTISEMAGRRSEFSSVLNRGGAQALYETLEAKTQALAAKK